MGIFISLKLSDTITQEEWQPVYENSLKMAQKFNFFDCGKKNINGENIYCIFPTEEDEYGWRVLGTFPDYKHAETQRMLKNIGITSRDTEPCEILRSNIDETVNCFGIWGNKTQGEPYHMGLLAIGCMAEQLLGIQAMVYGDITYGQCIKAAKMASDTLGEPIQPPISCRLNDLYKRIQNINGLTERQKLNLLLDVYLGDKNRQFDDFLQEHFSYEIILDYWKKRFENCNIDSINFKMLMKKYFESVSNLKLFCTILNIDKTDTENCAKLIHRILESKLHIKEKDCYDPFDYTKCSEPYTIHNLTASFFLYGAKNKAVDAYIPLEEIRSILTEYFDSSIDVNKIIDTHLLNIENNAEKSGHDIFTETANKFEDECSQYDINEYEDLYFFKPNSKFNPRMIEAIKQSFLFYYEIGESSECTELLEKTADELFHILAYNFRKGFLTEEHWKYIYDELNRDIQTFRRFYPLIKVKCNGNLDYLIRAFLDDEFWKYCCENFKENSEE